MNASRRNRGSRRRGEGEGLRVIVAIACFAIDLVLACAGMSRRR